MTAPTTDYDRRRRRQREGSNLAPPLVAVLALGLVTAPSTAGAADHTDLSVVVNSEADKADDAPGVDCLDPAAECTLRAAVQAANADPDVSLIEVPAGHYRLTLQGEGIPYEPASRFDPAVSSLAVEARGLTIRGPADGEVVIDGGYHPDDGPVDWENLLESSLFHIATGAEVTLERLTLTGGWATHPFGEAAGGAITMLFDSHLVVRDSRIAGNHASFAAGAIDAHLGTLSIERTTVAGNRAGIWAGAIETGSSATIEASTFVDNVAERGGAIDARGQLAVTSSTFSGNEASVHGGAIRVGGGDVGANVVVTSSTFAGNSAPEGAAFSNTGGTLSLLNTIVAGEGEQCSGATESQGFNLGNDDTCGFVDNFDQPDTDPLLGGLADNGGTTQTHALLPGSPAVESGLPAEHPSCQGTSDQRGTPRPQGHACDIGAYERSVQADDPDDPIDPDPVLPVEEQIADLIAAVEDANVSRQAQLTTALESALHHLASDRVEQACAALDRFVHHVHRQARQRDGLTEEQAQQFLESADAIRDELGC
jgi:CSLREA domain-containing protein